MHACNSLVYNRIIYCSISIIVMIDFISVFHRNKLQQGAREVQTINRLLNYTRVLHEGKNV